MPGSVDQPERCHARNCDSLTYKKDMSEETAKEESQARKAPVIPTDMKAFNQKVITEFRANRGQLSGPMAGRSVLLLTTTGARSGVERTTVLGFGRAGERLVVIASDNGAPSAPDWYHNLLARPIATVELGPEKFKVRAVTAGPDERDELAKVVPYLKQQQALTEREIPIVVLERS
jgi:deazaflavin-dependent oxidoreductase (nitroreductase family)